MSNDQLRNMPDAHGGGGTSAWGPSRAFGAAGGTPGAPRPPLAGGTPAAGASGSTSGCRHSGHAPAGRATSLAWHPRQVACPQPNTAQSALAAKLSRHTAHSRGTPSCSLGGPRTGSARTGAGRAGARSAARPAAQIQPLIMPRFLDFLVCSDRAQVAIGVVAWHAAHTHGIHHHACRAARCMPCDPAPGTRHPCSFVVCLWASIVCLKDYGLEGGLLPSNGLPKEALT